MKFCSENLRKKNVIFWHHLSNTKKKEDLPFRFTAQVAAKLWVHSSWVSALLVALPLYAQRPHHQVTRSGNTGDLIPNSAGKGKRLKACLTDQTPNENFQSFSVTRILFHHQIELLKRIVIVVFQYNWAVVEFPTLLSSQILTNQILQCQHVRAQRRYHGTAQCHSSNTGDQREKFTSQLQWEYNILRGKPQHFSFVTSKNGPFLQGAATQFLPPPPGARTQASPKWQTPWGLWG